MDYQEILREIRKRCRLGMNGDASAGMRKYGLEYKLNFGLMITQIKELASSFSANATLAALLWQQETRELKIMATMLFPVNEFTAELAEKWALEIPNQEIREQLVKNIFQELPYAETLSVEWARSENVSLRTTAYWLLGRLFLAKKMTSFGSLDSLSSIWKDVLSDVLYLRNSALLALRQLGRQDSVVAGKILYQITQLDTENETLRSEVYESLTFEFDFFFKNQGCCSE